MTATRPIQEAIALRRHEPEVICLETAELGDRSYILCTSGLAIAVDPQRDIDRILPVLDSRNVRLSHVLETHIHNDYVSGGLELCRVTGATYVIPAGEPVSYPCLAISDGQRIRVGDVNVLALHTPGHTSTHVSYIVERENGATAAFTGGSLLDQSVGRTDLAGRGTTEYLSRLQHRSVRRLSGLLTDSAVILPTHGFGSLCSAGSAVGVSSGEIRMGEQRTRHPALLMGEQAFVQLLASELDDYPRYYTHMAPRNREGPAAVDLSLPPLRTPAQLSARASRGEWVVDMRDRRLFAASHLVHTINIEMGDSFATYLGWLLPWGSPLSLLGGDVMQICTAQRALARIGIDRLASCAVDDAGHGERRDADGAATSGYPVVGFDALGDVLGRSSMTLLDVRRRREWEQSHLKGAAHIPLHDLADRMGEIPPGEVWVHCATGYRASTACSLLERSGRSVVLIDDRFTSAGPLGLEVAAGAEHP
jgi:hydroxyacylglutathione hydrolase